MKNFLLSVFTLCISFMGAFGEIREVKIGDFYYQLNNQSLTATIIKERGVDNEYKMSVINVPLTVAYEGLTYNVKLGAGCFYGSPNLSTVTIPTGIMAIPEGCFSGCQRLTTVNLPASLDSIYQGAFNGCTSLTSINLPEGLRYFG